MASEFDKMPSDTVVPRVSPLAKQIVDYVVTYVEAQNATTATVEEVYAELIRRVETLLIAAKAIRTNPQVDERDISDAACHWAADAANSQPIPTNRGEHLAALKIAFEAGRQHTIAEHLRAGFL